MLQFQFEIAMTELAKLEARLPCRLSLVETGEPKHANVGTKDRSWFDSGKVRKGRGCDYRHGLRTASFLGDLGKAGHATVYGVIESE